MLCTADPKNLLKVNLTNFQEHHESDLYTNDGVPMEIDKAFLFFAVGVSIVALTALARSPQGLFCKPIFRPWRSQLPSSPTLKDDFLLSILETILLSELNASRAPEWSYYYTSQSHFPGEGKGQGLWTKKKWEDFGIPETQIVTYKISISEPFFQRLALIDNSETLSPSVMYEAKLMEELPFNDPSEIRTPAFHGQSYSDNVTAQFVYANFGRDQDYDDLEQSHVEVKGKIAIVKSGMVWRGRR
ncbi:MAG: hypothetical protein LQ338_006025 [Usnochroma carphineum]|nr:MAG: hypothetical protein LQ338_006025 [Usnochroma carphineum]